MKTSLQLKPRPYLLVNQLKDYSWGTRGANAFIPRLLGIKAEDNQPYAELWMGTHSSGPSEARLDGAVFPLDQLITQHPVEILGQAVLEKFGGTLPYLFKVLSAAEALSIQVHPNKPQAEKLHARDPEHYPDNNHKPEIAVALDALTALVGFRRFSEIVDCLEEYPELAGCVGQNASDQVRQAKGLSEPEQQAAVRLFYSTLVKRSVSHKAELGEALTKLAQRLNNSSGRLREEERIFLNLRKSYPEPDVGLWSVFLFNLVHLKKGQGLFTPAGIPHAYLEGNIVECMANSDNVIRVGLTPKFTDVEALLEVLSYDLGVVPILEGEGNSPATYKTPAAEFQVSRISVEAGNTMKLQGAGPRILLLTQGEINLAWQSDLQASKENFKQGQSVLIPDLLKEIELTSTSSAEVFQAEVPLESGLLPTDC
jgi:mannose-6-phosphate isomerase